MKIPFVLGFLLLSFIPAQAQNKKGDIIKTNGQDTVLRLPKKETDDRKYLRFIGSEIMQMQFEAEKMSLEKRDTFIVDKLNEMVKNI